MSGKTAPTMAVGVGIVIVLAFTVFVAAPAAAQCQPMCEVPTKEPVALPVPWYLFSLLAAAVAVAVSMTFRHDGDSN